MTLPEYKDINEKPFPVNLTLKTKDEFDCFVLTLRDNTDIIYRGVNEAKYKIYSSAQRAWLTKDLRYNSSFNRFIYELLSGLREDKLLNDYLQSIQYKYNDVLGLALLQHYGSPSTLIDFTKDLNTALFFAIDGVKENDTKNIIGDYMSVYYINKKDCNKYLAGLINVLSEGLEDAIKKFIEATLMYSGITIDHSLITDISKFTMWSNPDNMDGGLSNFKISYLGNPLEEPTLTSYDNEPLIWSNWNLIAQKGCFIMYNEENNPLEEYMKEHKLPICCVNIHKSLVDYIRATIKINKDDIYPDLYTKVKSKYTHFLEKL